MVEDEKHIEIKWKDVKKYLETHNYNLEEQDWGEVREKIKELNAMERALMNRDIQKTINTPICIKKLVKKQKEYSEVLDEITPELIKKQRELQRATSRPLYLDYLRSSDPE